jgi:radical SAM superfamily enzyme YgiQ (UPF0313 family)
MVDVAQEVFKRGWRTVKLYFMIGLPGEDMDDVEAIVDLVGDIRAIGRRVHGRKAQVNVSVNVFVPKPHTPFQWVSLEPADSLHAKQSHLRRALRGQGLKLDYSDSEATLIEATLARGDRRLGTVIQRAWELGARFDAWDEQRKDDAWTGAFTETELDPGFYSLRRRSLDETFPWEVVSAGVHRRFLAQELERSQSEGTLVDCREQCHGCGILGSYGSDWTEDWQCPEPAPGKNRQERT